MANKPYPFSVCKECAGGGNGGGTTDGITKEYADQTYVKQESGKGLAHIFEVPMDEGTIDRTIIEVITKEGEQKQAVIPVYTSDLTNDSGYVTSKELGDIETALDSIIAIQNSLIGGDGV